MFERDALAAAIANLRDLLRDIGRAEFRAYGYAAQLREYRVALRTAHHS